MTSDSTRVVLVPGVLALLPEYAGLADPVRELRAACVEAVRWLGGDVAVLGDAQGRRVGEALLVASGVSRRDSVPPRPPDEAAYLVVGNGSARRSEKAPGFLDERSFGFDEALGAALRAGRIEVDEALATELQASVESIVELAGLLPDVGPATVTYEDDPFGVQYWVMRWTCGS